MYLKLILHVVLLLTVPRKLTLTRVHREERQREDILYFVPGIYSLPQAEFGDVNILARIAIAYPIVALQYSLEIEK